VKRGLQGYKEGKTVDHEVVRKKIEGYLSNNFLGL